MSSNNNGMRTTPWPLESTTYTHCPLQGGQRDFGLHKYAEAWAWSGFAVMVFDCEWHSWAGWSRGCHIGVRALMLVCQ